MERVTTSNVFLESKKKSIKVYRILMVSALLGFVLFYIAFLLGLHGVTMAYEDISKTAVNLIKLFSVALTILWMISIGGLIYTIFDFYEAKEERNFLYKIYALIAFGAYGYGLGYVRLNVFKTLQLKGNFMSDDFNVISNISNKKELFHAHIGIAAIGFMLLILSMRLLRQYQKHKQVQILKEINSHG